MSRDPADVQFYRTLLDAISDGVYFVDRERTILYWSPSAERITGYSAEEMVGRHCYDNILRHVDDSGREMCRSTCPLSDSIRSGRPHTSRAYLHHKSGHRVPVAIRVSPTTDGSGNVTGAVELFNDNSAQEAMRERIVELERQAMIDPLTQLANRRLMDSALSERRGAGLVMIDLDNFKMINDRWGHAVGDEVLKMVARTLMSNVRPQDVVGRWGGEEFLIVVPDTDETGLHGFAERVRALVEASSFEIDGANVSVTASIGTAMADDATAAIRAVEHADRAMYKSKTSGRNRVTRA